MEKFLDIESFLSFVEAQRRFTPKDDLHRMRYYCNKLGNPQKNLKCIHVTGTNGKGSVVAYLKELFMINDLKVGTFTSPYIVKFNERIQINGNYISDEDILKYANQIITLYDEFNNEICTTPSFFEFITLIAFLYFKEQKTDLAIIEVGIGGLLDSTNVIDPIASVIVNVSYDHMNVLGNSIEEILRQKLGITKFRRPLIVGLKDPKLLKIAESVALKNQAPIYKPLLEAFEIKKCDLSSTEFTTKEYGLVKLNLLGFHQIENALVAIETFKVTCGTFNISFNLDKCKIALQKTKWPGRLEVVSKEPLIVIDGGHNIDGIKRICEFVTSQEYQTKRVIFACSDNKEKEKMIKQISNVFDEIILTSFSYKRHSSALELLSYANNTNAKVINDLDEIIEIVKNNQMELNLFLGSLYFVSEIRPKLISEME